jgi:hypothetical protein
VLAQRWAESVSKTDCSLSEVRNAIITPFKNSAIVSVMSASSMLGILLRFASLYGSLSIYSSLSGNPLNSFSAIVLLFKQTQTQFEKNNTNFKSDRAIGCVCQGLIRSDGILVNFAIIKSI